MTTYSAEFILSEMGRAGLRLDHIHSVEAGAGNMSVAARDVTGVEEFFPEAQADFKLPLPVPELAGFTVFVTGSGCRNREVAEAPRANVSALVINEGGLTATWRTHSDRVFTRPTSEFNSHLAVHAEQVGRRGLDFHSVIHSQPPYIVQLSHEPDVTNDEAFNRAILRWEPETIVQLPEGVKFLEFMVPGSDTLMQNNVAGLVEHQITIWAKHGIMVRSDVSPLAAVDKVEYAETGAMYELRNRAAGSRGEGLKDEELRAVIRDFNVNTKFFQ